jgi:hypothetical protein
MIGDGPTCRRYFRLQRRDLAYLTFILESYEGIASMSTIDRQETLVVISAPPGMEQTLDGLLTALSEELELTEVGPPEETEGGAS